MSWTVWRTSSNAASVSLAEAFTLRDADCWLFTCSSSVVTVSRRRTTFSYSSRVTYCGSPGGASCAAAAAAQNKIVAAKCSLKSFISWVFLFSLVVQLWLIVRGNRSDVIHQVPPFLAAEHARETRHGFSPLADLPEQLAIALAPNRGRGEVSGMPRQVRSIRAVSLARVTVARGAFPGVNPLPRCERFLLGGNGIGRRGAPGGRL